VTRRALKRLAGRIMSQQLDASHPDAPVVMLTAY
jgi:hypothetical protein